MTVATKKSSYGFVCIGKSRTYVTLSNGVMAGFPHFPNGKNKTDEVIKEAIDWVNDRAEKHEVRDER
jgi:hypothetical protein